MVQLSGSNMDLHGAQPPRFSGRFADFEDFVADFYASTRAWGPQPDGRLLQAALTLALTEDTLGTVRSAAEERSPSLLPVGEGWQAGGLGTWQALRAIYGQSAPVLEPLTEAQYHVACGARSHTFCPHCKVRARRLLDAAQQRRWGLVLAELARDARLVNYLPEDRERTDDSSSERSFFGFGHWAAFHGDADAVRAIAQLAPFRPSLETRRGRTASEVASDVARARKSFRHARVASLLDDIEVGLERGKAPSRRTYETESRAAFAAARSSAVLTTEHVPPALEATDARREGARPDFRREAPYRWPSAGLDTWPESFRRG